LARVIAELFRRLRDDLVPKLFAVEHQLSLVESLLGLVGESLELLDTDPVRAEVRLRVGVLLPIMLTA
jgi:hypothetical protein